MNYKKTVRIMTYHHSYTHLASHLPQSYVIPVRSRLARACHVALGQGGRERVCSTTHSDKKSWKSQRKNTLRLGGRFGHLRQMQNHSWFYDWGD